MQIRELLSRDTVVVGLKAADKNAVINGMIDLLGASDAVTNIEQVRSAIFKREQTMSTGVGKGLALPHAKCDAVTRSVAALATLDVPVEYGSIDDEPVSIVFMLVGSPDTKSQHVKVLSRISRLMNRADTRSEFLACETSEDLLDILRKSESDLLDG